MKRQKKPLDRADFAVVQNEVLPDGRTKLTLKNGAVIIMPPVPGGDWLQRKAKELCDIQYRYLESQIRDKRKPPAGA